MHLLAGLGNPGDRYYDTRHNIGFLFLDYLARRHGFTFAEAKWQAQQAKVSLWGAAIVFVKPLTFMNLSGTAVVPMARFYKIPPERLIVVHDDLDLPLGRVKMAVNRGSGGHNGIRSIVEQLGSRDFIRFRAGIGRPAPESPIPPARYVLSPFPAEERKPLAEAMACMEEGLRLLLGQGPTMAMNWLNSRH